ncbi:MAG: thioesterase family protein [bacterium]|nr:thioesterase family protein [bacterium]
MLEIGIKGTHTTIVSEKNTAKTMGSGTLDVFATPALIALMEECAWRSVADELEEGCGTVGTMLEVKHTAATPVGMKVVCESKLVQVDGRRLVFEVEAHDEAGMIGSGRHERFIVYNDRFQEKANQKIQK